MRAVRRAGLRCRVNGRDPGCGAEGLPLPARVPAAFGSVTPTEEAPNTAVRFRLRCLYTELP